MVFDEAWRSPDRWTAPGLALAALMLALPVGAAPVNACSRPISLGTGQWEPYAYFDAQQRFTGIDVDIVRAIFREAGCQLVELSPKPPARNLFLFGMGEVDLMVGASRTAEREKLAYFSLPYRDETVALFSLADQALRYREVRSFADFLAGKHSMVAPRAGWYGAQFERYAGALEKDGRLRRFGDPALGVVMLAAGRASFLLGDAAGVEHAAARAGVKVQPLPFLLVDAPVHLMLSKATVTAADVALLDAAIVRLGKRGVFAQIRRSYGGL